MYKTIIYLHPHFTIPGGAGKFVLETGKGLAKKGYEIIVISIKSSDNIVGDYKEYIKFIDIGGPLSSQLLFWVLFPISYFKIAKILNTYKNYVLFQQVFPSNWWGFLYKKFHSKTQLIWMCQEPSAFIHSKEWINSIHSPLKRLIAKAFNISFKKIDIYLSKNVDIVLANSLFTKSNILKVYNYPQDKIQIVYPGIDLNVFKPNAKVRKKKQFISVGRLTKFKRFDLAIRSISVVAKNYPDIRLLIVGGGEEKEHLNKLVKSLSLSKNVFFLGNITNDQLVTHYQESLATILLSYNEPFGIVPIESQACETPIIVASAGGFRETVKQGKSGLLLDNVNEKLLSTVLLDVINKKHKFRIDKEFIQKFDWNNATTKIQSILSK